MRVFKVPDTLAPKYHGAGYALAAITGGQLIDIRYLSDLGQFEVIDRMGFTYISPSVKNS